MRNKGLNYNSAHKEASKIELEARQGKIDSEEVLSKEVD